MKTTKIAAFLIVLILAAVAAMPAGAVRPSRGDLVSAPAVQVDAVKADPRLRLVAVPIEQVTPVPVFPSPKK